MKEIVKTLLMEGVDEGTIHRVLDVLEDLAGTTYKRYQDASAEYEKVAKECDDARAKHGNDSKEAKAAWDKANAAYGDYRKKGKQFDTAIKLKYDHELHPHNDKTKGERGQKEADYKKSYKLKDGDQYLAMKDLRNRQDEKNGHQIATLKSIHRHNKKSK